MILGTYYYNTRYYDYSKILELIKEFKTFMEVVDYLNTFVSCKNLRTDMDVIRCE